MRQFRYMLRLHHDGVSAREIGRTRDKPGGRDAILPEPIGLDGHSRSKRTAYAFVANKGSWLDSRTFMLARRFLGEGAMACWTLHFEGDQLNLRFRNTDGYAIELRGEAAN